MSYLNWASIVFSLLFILQASAGTSSSNNDLSENISCSPAYWVQNPSLTNGHYQSTRTIECKIKKSDLETSHFYDKLIAVIENDKNLHISQGPNSTESEKNIVSRYLVTEENEKESTSIDEERVISFDKKENQVSYSVDALEIRGRGNSSFLEKLNFSLLIKDQFTFYTFILSNSITVKHPWYAPIPLFKSIAEKSAITKFDESRIQFLNQILGSQE